MTQIDENYSPKLLLGLESLWREQTFVDTTLVFGIGCTFGLCNVKTGSLNPHSQFVFNPLNFVSLFSSRENQTKMSGVSISV